jgi:hypothetical protein
VIVEITSLYAGDGKDDGVGVVVGLQKFGFGDIEGGEGSVEVKMKSLGIPRLAIGQITSKPSLPGISTWFMPLSMPP